MNYIEWRNRPPYSIPFATLEEAQTRKAELEEEFKTNPTAYRDFPKFRA